MSVSSGLLKNCNTSTSSSGLLPSAGSSSDDDDQPLSVLSSENRLQAISSTLLKPSAFYSKDNKCSSSFDPVLVLPHPSMAGERKITKGGRKRRHAAILTDTPEKRALEAENENRKAAKKKPETKKSQVRKTNKSTGERSPD